MLIVTRHKALVEYIREIGLAPAGTRVISHASVEDVKNEVVIGVVPYSLGCHAYSVTEIPLTLTKEMRGKELDIETLRRIAGKPRTYHVFEAETHNKDAI